VVCNVPPGGTDGPTRRAEAPRRRWRAVQHASGNERARFGRSRDIADFPNGDYASAARVLLGPAMMRSSLRRRYPARARILLVVCSRACGSLRARRGPTRKESSRSSSSAAQPSHDRGTDAHPGRADSGRFPGRHDRACRRGRPTIRRSNRRRAPCHPLAVVAIFGEPERSSADVWVADRSTATNGRRSISSFEPPRGKTPLRFWR